VFSWSVELDEPKPWVSFVCATAISLIAAFYALSVFTSKEWRTVKTSSRLSTDAPEGRERPITEDDFLVETEGGGGYIDGDDGDGIIEDINQVQSPLLGA
jgi:hypothetical protein